MTGSTYGSLGAPNAGNSDGFLAKVSMAGQLLWARQIDDPIVDVSPDRLGGIYACGRRETVDEDSMILADALVTKYDTSGTQLWSRQLGTESWDHATSVSADAGGNVYVGGYTQGSLAAANAGGYDAFLLKYDAAGSLAWARQMGDWRSESGVDTAVDQSGNIYVAGAVGTGVEVANPSFNGFVARYSADGVAAWWREFGTSQNDRASAVATDGSDNVYVAGMTRGSLGGANVGGVDAFIVKYDSSGNELWSRQFGSSADDAALELAVDAEGNVYITGYRFGVLVPGEQAGYDTFLAKYDAVGNALWTIEIGTSANETGFGVAVASDGGVYLAGGTYGGLGGANAGSEDAFLLRYDIPEPAMSSGLFLLAALFARQRRRRAAAAIQR